MRSIVGQPAPVDLPFLERMLQATRYSSEAFLGEENIAIASKS